MGYEIKLFKAASWLNLLAILLGLYLSISPWVVGFNSNSRLTVPTLVTGIYCVVCGHLAARNGSVGGLDVVLIGIWTIVAPHLMSGSLPSSASVSNAVTGSLLVFVVSVGRYVNYAFLKLRYNREANLTEAEHRSLS
ncbi:SPW repeat protein [Streptomyces sp. NBC_00638]|uniref:SPW repeat domain-containing protein n=1 Tax=Streptomyces sp. NBC_00638 TaxID=2975794 RepID=UPI00338EE21D